MELSSRPKELFRSPNRMEAGADRERLIAKELEASGSTVLAPQALEIGSIIELPSLFQPRGWSLEMWAGNSVEHVRRMARVLKGGKALDPLLVMSFGNEWYLVDGHHRLAAYREAKWVAPIPVVALQSALSGIARVSLAEDESLAQNSKNTLNLNDREKTDAAWRAIVARPVMSKRDTSKQYEVSKSSVANMRRVKQELLDYGLSLSELEHLSWRHAWGRADWNKRPDADDADAGYDWTERQRLMLIKKLAPAFKMNVSAMLLLNILNDWREGFATEMEWAVDARREARRMKESSTLDI